MKSTNLEFSKKELELIINSDFILTKNRIIEKIITLFGALSESYKIIVDANKILLPEEVVKLSPKIYKGEQYKSLPYVMLDYPRCFSKTDSLAIRSFFWWGNYFSITLHLSGKYVLLFEDKLAAFIQNPVNEDWFFNVHENEWEHHFEKDNYISFKEMNQSNKLSTNKLFIKIAAKLSLNNWQQAEEFFTSHFKMLVECLCS